jgi:hypothetical protein
MRPLATVVVRHSAPRVRESTPVATPTAERYEQLPTTAGTLPARGCKVLGREPPCSATVLADPQLAEAQRLLSDFAAFWEAKTSPAERHRLATTLSEQIRTIVAVKPRGAFVPYFQAATKTHQSQSGSSRVQSGSDGDALWTPD